jgi:PBP1b-binding outer membrane lipoprotein LpoB
VEKEHFIILMEIPILVNGQMTERMDMEYISNKMVQYIKENGKMIINMVLEKNNVLKIK